MWQDMSVALKARSPGEEGQQMQSQLAAAGQTLLLGALPEG